MKLACYISNGYPSPDGTIEYAKNYAMSGSDIIQIDFPSYNPYLESDAIKQRMKSALAITEDFNVYMNTIAKIHVCLPTMIIFLLIYEDTLSLIGIDRFIEFCVENNIENITLIGSKNGNYRSQIMNKEIKISSYLPYDLPTNDIQLIDTTNGFIYLQAKSHLSKDHFLELPRKISFLREKYGLDRPIFCGVGLQTLADIEFVKESGADGAFIGSSLFKIENDAILVSKLITEMKEIASREELL